MGLIGDCDLYFGTKSLYEVLSLEKTASAAELKKAFKKAALLSHPDKVVESEKEEATRKFQVLAKVHFILSDTEKKAIYDETGIVDDENSLTVDDSSPDFWENYFRNLFPKITKQQIRDYVSKYKDSEEERKDLIELYNKYEGDMDKITQSLIAHEVEEEERICEILHDLIKENTIPSFPQFVNESATKKAKRHKREMKRRTKEAAEVEELAASQSLINALTKRTVERKSNFDDMISGLEAKYGKKDSGRKKKKV